MDVANTRFGTLARDRDELALQVQNLFKRFLEEFSTEEEPTIDSQSGDKQFKSKYADEALLLLDSERNTLFIDFKDITVFDTNLAEDLTLDFYRFYPYICRATASYVREEKLRRSEGEEQLQVKKDLDRPVFKNKNYYVGFYNFSIKDKIRELTCNKIGTLTKISGQVVRTHSVHPELILGRFRCNDCLTEQYAEQQFRYTQPTVCANENCANRTRFTLILEDSRFTDFQRLRIQETQHELVRGSIPRSFDVVIRGADQVECIQPGDDCQFVGTLLAVPDVGQMMNGAIGTVARDMGGESGVTGLKSIGVREMTYSIAFLANACINRGQTKPSISTDSRDDVYGIDMDANYLTTDRMAKIQKMRQDQHLLDNLCQSLFSSIYGSDDVKRALILQLLGGVSKKTTTGTKLRGDINVCLVGDPSTAKSQFLKIISDFQLVKTVYASGKASSASGLTAAVVRDQDGGFVIEAGALMLADGGMCCIDEFDKMDLKDQVALHEAMEQQTISISKAGVSATLNARASILAAANPIGGTYNTNLDLKKNLNFSLAIMSRFDLFFTIIDPGDIENDRAIATRICEMHKNYADWSASKRHSPYTFEDVRLYLKHCRTYSPKIPLSVEEIIVKEYLRLRSESHRSKKSWRITTRQLESLIRLSEAIAKVNCSDVVKPEYVMMASRLVEKTIVHVGSAEVDLTEYPIPSDITSEAGTQTQSQSQQQESTQPTLKKITMPFPEFRDMAEVLILKLKIETENPESEVVGMRRFELVDWYLQQCVQAIGTEKELIEKRDLCCKVINRLIRNERVLMELKDDGQIVDYDQVSQQSDADHEDRLIIINPTMDPDSIFDN